MSDEICPVRTTPSEFWPNVPGEQCERPVGHMGHHYGEGGFFHLTQTDSSTTKENN